MHKKIEVWFQIKCGDGSKPKKELEDAGKDMDKNKKDFLKLKDRNKTILIDDRLKGKENRALLKKQ